VKPSLCGQQPCQHICSRVCHCPAGMERVRLLWLFRRGYRGESQTRHYTGRPYPPNVNPQTGEISEPRHHLGKVKEAVLSNLFGAKKPHEPRSPSRYGTLLLKPYASIVILAGLLAFMGIVVLLGMIILEGDFSPGYEPPQIYFQEWQ